jgi:hypothetical protein
LDRNPDDQTYPFKSNKCVVINSYYISFYQLDSDGVADTSIRRPRRYSECKTLRLVKTWLQHSATQVYQENYNQRSCGSGKIVMRMQNEINATGVVKGCFSRASDVSRKDEAGKNAFDANTEGDRCMKSK